MTNLQSKTIKLMGEYKIEDALMNIVFMSAYYLYIGIGFIATYFFFYLFAPQIFSYQYFDFWYKADFNGMFKFVTDRWLIFSTITISNIVFLIVSDKNRVFLSSPYNKLFAGLVSSIFAGVSEEIVYRWLLFFASIGTIAGTDYLTGGFVFGHGLIYLGFMFTKFFVNLATFGSLSNYIYSTNWLIGAAMIVSAAKFREGHENYGPLGYWFAWYFGLFTQVIVFNFGILPAIVLHIFIDVIQDLLIFTDRILNRPLLNARMKKK
jgi:Type II CAAX prenyl endopeptidase Rce1-like